MESLFLYYYFSFCICNTFLSSNTLCSCKNCLSLSFDLPILCNNSAQRFKLHQFTFEIFSYMLFIFHLIFPRGVDECNLVVAGTCLKRHLFYIVCYTINNSMLYYYSSTSSLSQPISRRFTTILCSMISAEMKMKS